VRLYEAGWSLVGIGARTRVDPTTGLTRLRKLGNVDGREQL